MSKKRISVQSAKAKGRRFQQWVCEKLSSISGLKYGKDLDIDSRPMGQSGTDVILRGKAAEAFPLSIECKAQEKWSIPGWIDQAKKNRKKGTDWILFCKRNNENPIVVIDAMTFFNLYCHNVNFINLVHSKEKKDD